MNGWTRHTLMTFLAAVSFTTRFILEMGESTQTARTTTATAAAVTTRAATTGIRRLGAFVSFWKEQVPRIDVEQYQWAAQI